MNTCYKILPFLLLMAYAQADELAHTLDNVTVTAAPSEKPTLVRINPKAPFQPIPPADGAGLLKTVPNMSVIRKGGVSGDPLFRGLGGSRLAITANDGFLFGGCGMRMDPPTAYIFPDAYDEVLITKGPQTVTQGPGVVSGAVQFVRKPSYFPQAGLKGNVALTGGSFGRVDAFADVTGGFRWGYANLNLVHNQAHDYQDGAGNRYHSSYKRDSRSITIGVTPDENTVIEAGYDYSRSWAEYADRGMDGIVFDRDAWRLRAERKKITSWLSSLKFEYGHSYVDHVMDNYSRRPNNKMRRVNNPDRTTDTLRIQGQLELGNTSSKIGLDYMKDDHTIRRGQGRTNATADRYVLAERRWDQKFRNIGFFAESTWQMNEQNRLIFGLRHDQTKARYNNQPNHINDKTYRLSSGFARYEYRNNGWTYFAGLGIAQRAPDFWERMRDTGRISAETNVELDGGLRYRSDKLTASFNLFASNINNFILIDATKNTRGLARNIKAQRVGFESDIAYTFLPNWKVGNTIAYTYGKNKTDHLPLAQTPPLEAKTYLSYDNGTYSGTVLMRNVAAQHRYALGQGNIIGQDSGPSPAFTVFSVNGGWKPHKNINLTAGIDNLFDKKYREFINRSGSTIAGFNPSNGTQLYEPGRQFWARLQVTF